MLQRPRTALLGALACFVALVATGVVSHLVPAGRRLDGEALETFSHVRAHDVDDIFARAVHFGDVLPYLMMAIAVVLLAQLHGRRRLAAILTVVMVGAPATTELLKVVAAETHNHTHSLGAFSVTASWPSGHAAGAMTVALAAVLVSPVRFRPAVALIGGALALAVGYAVLVLAWHFPSDVIGGYLVAAGWVMAGVGASRRWPDTLVAARGRRPVAMAPPVIATAALATAAGLLIASYRPSVLLGRASEHPSVLDAAIGIAAVAVLLPALLVRIGRSG